jgi:hypothetical protein
MSKKYGCAFVTFTHQPGEAIYASTMVDNGIRHVNLEKSNFIKYVNLLAHLTLST